MDIALMSHIPDNLIMWEIKDPVHGHRQLHHSQVGGKMPSCLRHRMYQNIPNLLAKRLQFRDFQCFQFFRRQLRQPRLRGIIRHMQASLY